MWNGGNRMRKSLWISTVIDASDDGTEHDEAPAASVVEGRSHKRLNGSL